MTVNRTYQCDLCHESNDWHRLRGLYWQATVTGEQLVERPGRDGIWASPREWANPNTHKVSAEYYRIIDRIARGEKP